ncbi:hypothetical protein KAU11_07180 [Candidatus Babeliales bacterium]|nr:hypothetical protein [Candidatus Babeliales bacterium]
MMYELVLHDMELLTERVLAAHESKEILEEAARPLKAAIKADKAELEVVIEIRPCSDLPEYTNS